MNQYVLDIFFSFEKYRSAAHQRDRSLRFRHSYHRYSAPNRYRHRYAFRHSGYDFGLAERRKFGEESGAWNFERADVLHKRSGRGRTRTDREVTIADGCSIFQGTAGIWMNSGVCNKEFKPSTY